jgi:hypothetical protein
LSSDARSVQPEACPCTITTEGVGAFIDGETIIGAITGGTGKYESASGHATFEFNPTGESDVTFKLQK